jgi:hypothetical protein
VYEGNLIEHAVQQSEDAGAFYGVGNEYALVNLGNAIRNNTFRHIRPLDRLHLAGPKSPALYFDNGLSSYLVENNRCGCESEVGAILLPPPCPAVYTRIFLLTGAQQTDITALA